jgi:hypothetical protein
VVIREDEDDVRTLGEQRSREREQCEDGLFHGACE